MIVHGNEWYKLVVTILSKNYGISKIMVSKFVKFLRQSQNRPVISPTVPVEMKCRMYCIYKSLASVGLEICGSMKHTGQVYRFNVV